MKSILIGSDHAGFEHKSEIIRSLMDISYSVRDFGCIDKHSVDYPVIAHSLAREVNDEHIGILLCGSGNGMAMTANKYRHIRAALVWNTESAILAMKHNNANIICLPGRFLSVEDSISIVLSFLNSSFDKGRHMKRLKKIV